MGSIRVLEYGNGRNIVVLASPVAPPNVWAKIFRAETFLKAKSLFPRDDFARLGRHHSIEKLLPRVEDSALQFHLRRVACYEVCRAHFNRLGSLASQILEIREGWSDYDPSCRNDWCTMRDNVEIFERVLRDRYDHLRWVGSDYSSRLTPAEAANISSMLPMIYLQLHLVDEWMYEVRYPSTWLAEFSFLTGKYWRFPRSNFHRWGEPQPKPKEVPFDESKSPLFIDISSSGEEDALLAKYTDLCSDMGIDVYERKQQVAKEKAAAEIDKSMRDVRIREALADGYDFDDNGYRITEEPRDIAREMVEVGRVNGYGNRGFGYKGSFIRHAIATRHDEE